jgi:hypothetical protein
MLNRRFEMFVFAMTTAIGLRRFLSRSGSLPGVTAIMLSSTLIACVGCGDSKVAVPPSSTPGTVAASPSAETKADALADVLLRAKTGDIDTAIQRFVSSAPDNWIESTSLEDIRMSEASFANLDPAEKSRFQQQFIDRVGEIKGFTRTVMDRANDARQKGDTETAERYLEAVNRLGRQLRDSDTVIVFQQTGKALAEVKLSE